MKTISIIILAIFFFGIIAFVSAQPVITILNPEENSTITTRSTWLKVKTNEESVCEYSLCRFHTEPGWGGGGCSRPQNMSITGGMSISGEVLHLQFIDGLEETINNEIIHEWYRIDVTCENSGGRSRESVIFYVAFSEEIGS